MAIVTDSEIVTRSETIKNETTSGANTATRVGSLFRDSWDTMLAKFSNYVTGSSFTSYGISVNNSLAGKQDIVKITTANIIALLNNTYHVTASATFTDPTPVEGRGFEVVVRNGTATVGGVAYSVAGTVIKRIFHSGSWANYVIGSGAGSTPATQVEAETTSDSVEANRENTKTITARSFRWAFDRMFSVVENIFGASTSTKALFRLPNGADKTTSPTDGDVIRTSANGVEIRSGSNWLRFVTILRGNPATPRVINQNTDGSFSNSLEVRDLYAGDIDDSGGTRTSAQLNAAFPSAVINQRVTGTSGKIYEKFSTNWRFYTSAIV